MIVSVLLFAILTVVHGIMFNMFGNFFSFSSMGFTGDGMAFMEGDYIKIRKLAIIAVIIAIAAMIFAAVIAEKSRVSKKRVLSFVILIAVSLCGIISARMIIKSTGADDTNVSWDDGISIQSDEMAYNQFKDQGRCLYLTGLYQYSVRDLMKSSGLLDKIENGKRYEEIEKYADNKQVIYSDKKGAAKGKNLIMVQLEAIDTWMITEEYMPNTYSLMNKSTEFTNYWATVFIQAGTFNSEFITNTGIIPATGVISKDVYTNNTFTYSLANMFKREGYSCNSFHGSKGTVYNRGEIHKNLGYKDYFSGDDMGMYYYQMDSELIKGYDLYTSDSPFFSFIITFSGHGPYNYESEITKENIDAAKSAVDKRLDYDLTDEEKETFTIAISHAMETDKFIGELVDKLEEDGKMDDTVLLFYADHYDYYLLNDPLLMQMKNAQDILMLQRVPCFIYDSDIAPSKIDKVVSSLDIMPTLTSLFGLDADLSYFIGNDMFAPDAGGYVIFKNNSWYDGNIFYSSAYSQEQSDYINQMNYTVYTETQYCDSILKTDFFKDNH